MSFAVALLMSVILPIFIVGYKCFIIRDVIKEHGCSILEAMKICEKRENNSMNKKFAQFHSSANDQYKPSYSNSNSRFSSYNDDHRHSPSYSYLPQNIHHKF